MARKRVTEEDLLDFRSRADMLAQEVGLKYEEMEKQKRAEPEPVREIGLLILADDDSEGLRRFVKRIEARGIAVERADILGYEPIDRFDRTPSWQRRLIQAQSAYTNLKKRANRVGVLGYGQSVPLATLIAEEYPVDALIAVGAFSGNTVERAGKRAPTRVNRIAKNNLFSIVCPILTILPGGLSPRASASIKVFGSRTRAEDVRLLEMRNTKLEDVFTEREGELSEAVCEFLVNR